MDGKRHIDAMTSIRRQSNMLMLSQDLTQVCGGEFVTSCVCFVVKLPNFLLLLLKNQDSLFLLVVVLLLGDIRSVTRERGTSRREEEYVRWNRDSGSCLTLHSLFFHSSQEHQHLSSRFISSQQKRVWQKSALEHKRVRSLDFL